MKLEVGMYVRTKDGEIHKIKSINDEYIEYENGFGVPYELKEYIVKASYNIIDILEEGDYANGVEVINIDDEWITMSDIQLPILKSIANGMIKSVVTHEQMEQMAYKVGE